MFASNYIGSELVQACRTIIDILRNRRRSRTSPTAPNAEGARGMPRSPPAGASSTAPATSATPTAAVAPAEPAPVPRAPRRPRTPTAADQLLFASASTLEALVAEGMREAASEQAWVQQRERQRHAAAHARSRRRAAAQVESVASGTTALTPLSPLSPVSPLSLTDATSSVAATTFAPPMKQASAAPAAAFAAQARPQPMEPLANAEGRRQPSATGDRPTAVGTWLQGDETSSTDGGSSGLGSPAAGDGRRRRVLPRPNVLHVMPATPLSECRLGDRVMVASFGPGTLKCV